VTLVEAMGRMRRGRYVILRHERDSETGSEMVTACVYEVPDPEGDPDAPGPSDEDTVLVGISAPLGSPEFEALLVKLIEDYA